MSTLSREVARAATQVTADARPIVGSPNGYFVTREGKVFSSVTRKFWGNGWREMAVDANGMVRIPVLTGTGMVYRKRSVNGLVRAAFGGVA